MNKIFEECIKEFQLDSKKQLLAFKLNGVKKGYEILYGKPCEAFDGFSTRINTCCSIEDLNIIEKEIEEVRKELF